MIISGTESFLLRAEGSRGVLLIHGFTGSPAELRLLGEYLNARGSTVLCMRLAGHGSNEKDLERSDRAAWFDSVLDGLSILSGLCDSISLVGHSMGGLLALKASTLERVPNGISIERLVTLAAPIFIDDSLHLSELPPIDQCVGLSVHKARRRLKNVPRAVNELYRRMPLSSVHELVGVIDETKKILADVKTPTLIVHGKSDHTTPYRSAQFIFDRIGSGEKRIELIEGMGHLLPLEEGREKVFELTSEFLRR